MDGSAIWDAVHREQAALADLLETLTPDERDHSSLCPGWRLRDVAAHVISSPRIGFADLVASL